MGASVVVVVMTLAAALVEGIAKMSRKAHYFGRGSCNLSADLTISCPFDSILCIGLPESERNIALVVFLGCVWLTPCCPPSSAHLTKEALP